MRTSSWCHCCCTCAPCAGTTFDLDATASYDDDDDPLKYVWSTSSGYASLSSSTRETSTIRLSNLPATHGVTTTYTATVVLRAVDCAEATSEDTVSFTFDCIGT